MLTFDLTRSGHSPHAKFILSPPVHGHKPRDRGRNTILCSSLALTPDDSVVVLGEHICTYSSQFPNST